MSFFQLTGTGYIVRIQAVPGAAASRIVGLYGDRLKVRIAAPPEKGEANEELLAFLARQLQLPKDQLRLKSGARNRAKIVEIINLDVALTTRLQALTPPD
jgi:hypothetical protein